MNPNISKSLLGGFVGTLMMSLMMKFAAPMMIGQAMDIAALLGNMMGGIYALGITAHIMLGVFVFPLLYAFLLFRILPGVPFVKAAMAALMGHLVYGGLLGFIAGKADCCCSVDKD